MVDQELKANSDQKVGGSAELPHYAKLLTQSNCPQLYNKLQYVKKEFQYNI